MSRILSPYSLKPQDFSQSLICKQTGIEVPKRFVDEYTSVPPLWLITIGYPRHGKTVYLSALTLMLERIGALWQGTHHRYLDNFTYKRVEQMHQEAKSGTPPDKTPIKQNRPDKIIRPLLMHIKDIPTAGSYCAVMYDVAGEAFLAKENINEISDPLREVRTLWFLVSLHDLEISQTNTLSDLFNIYSDVMFDMGISLKGRTLIVVYTKADLYEFPTDVQHYLSLDPLRSLIYAESYDNLPNDFDINKYVEEMQTISDKLENFTLRLNGGASFVYNAKAEGMTLRFCATSALGQSPNQKTGHIDDNAAKRLRVLDPFIWAVWLHKDDEEKRQSYILILDDNPDSNNVFKDNLPKQIWTALSEMGTVVTFTLGDSRPVAEQYQSPPEQPGHQRKLPLIGSILENLDPNVTKAIIITNKAIRDLSDFHKTKWQDSLLLVSVKDSTFNWENIFYFRNSDDLSSLVHRLRNW